MTTDTLKSAFTEAIGLDSSTDWNAVQYGSTAGWDSMAHMQLVAAIESQFDVMLSTDQVIELGSFGKAKEILAQHGICFDA
jgi:acyl carrier protein